MEDKGKGAGNIELPEKELGFLSGLGEDTPSRWLTFNGTPGNSTPGTAFGSPFWASLSQVKQHSPSATNPKSYSPSKELNPFELSFFPKQDSTSTQATSHDGVSIGQTINVKREDKDDGPDSRRSSLNSSLKRPFQDAVATSSAASDILVRDNNLNELPDGPLPSWKRPKFTVDSKQNSSTGTSSDMLGSSPAVGGPSPDAGSPASSIVPTPNLQSAVLPYRKTSLPPDQLEAARLQASLPDTAAILTGRAAIPPPYEIHIPPDAAYGAAAANAAFAPIVQKHQPNQLQQSNYPSQLPPFQAGQQYQHGNRFHQPQPQPLILPAKHIQQGQRSGSPYSEVPSSAATTQAPLSAVSAGAVNNAATLSNPNAIPYANGRPPSAQPTHSSTSIGGSARAGRRAKGKAAEALMEEVDDEDEDRGFYSSTSSAAATKPGKKGKKNNASSKKEREASILEASSNKRKDRSKNTIVEEPPQPVQEVEGEDDEEEGKRKAFLERNRQAACRSRQKKKEWINGLESHAADLQAQNSALTTEIENLRKEMFALRHTLSFHERCGCPSIQDWVKQNGPAPGLVQHQPHGMPAQHPIPMQAVPPLAPQQSQLQQHPQALVQHYQPEPMPQAPLPMAPTTMAGSPPQSAAFQPARQPMPLAQDSVAPTARPAGVPLLRPQAINLNPQSLIPRPPQNFNVHSSTPSGNDIARPGSAGASFGLSTPNFADLFGSFMNRGNGPTPGGLSFSPQLPNTFGLSMQDIPVRPASAPPTPSPALDIRVLAGSDYFSSKAPVAGAGAATASFGDLFASISQNPHSAAVMA